MTSRDGSGAPDLSRGGPDREQHGTRGGMGGRGGGNTSKNFQQLLQQQQQLLQHDIGEKEADAGRQRLRRHRYEPEHEKLAEKLALERSKHDEEKRKLVKEHEELNDSLLRELEKQKEDNKRLEHKIKITAAELNKVSAHSKDQSQKFLAMKASAQVYIHSCMYMYTCMHIYMKCICTRSYTCIYNIMLECCPCYCTCTCTSCSRDIPGTYNNSCLSKHVIIFPMLVFLA